MVIESAGKHANAVFSYGEGTTVNVSNSVIETTGDCSGGIMTTGGATMNATNLNISTTGNSSAAIRSDRGGGKVTVSGGIYKTSGTGSPAIYSTADITVRDATLESTASQGIVVEGKNSVTLENTAVKADNNTKNSDKSDFYQGVMIYQSMSGDASEGTASYTMKGGSFENANGDIFFVNNTTANINLDGVVFTNNGDGVFLRAAAAGWGKEGSNGGHVDLTANNQNIDGDILTDAISGANIVITGASTFNGAINPEAASGDVYVELGEGAKWVLTADSHISSLTCLEGSIDLNGHTLYVGDSVYEAGTASTGARIEHPVSASTGNDGQPPEGQPDGEKPADAPEPPDGEAPAAPDGNAPEGQQPADANGDNAAPAADGEQGTANSSTNKTPPAKPSGDASSSNGGTPPAKPSGEKPSRKPSSSTDNSNTASGTSDSSTASNSNSEHRHHKPSNANSNSTSGSTSTDGSTNTNANSEKKHKKKSSSNENTENTNTTAAA